jgi:hypothetical protein
MVGEGTGRFLEQRAFPPEVAAHAQGVDRDFIGRGLALSRSEQLPRDPQRDERRDVRHQLGDARIVDVGFERVHLSRERHWLVPANE